MSYGVTKVQVFLVLTLSCVAVITTSIWLMLNCRESFATVRPMIPEHALFCTNMGMPALFACCTILFTVFGLGCTGRRLTGYALIIISSVEILQSVTTLAFYKCNTIDHRDILDTVNSSLTACHRPVGYPTPLFYIALENGRAPSSEQQRVKRDDARFGRHGTSIAFRGATSNVPRVTSTKAANYSSHIRYLTYDVSEPATRRENAISDSSTLNPKETPAESSRNSFTRDTESELEFSRSRDKKLIEEFHNKMRIHVNPGIKLQTSRTTGHENAKTMKGSGEGQCWPNSRFFTQLSLKMRSGEVQECLDVCRTYLTVCPPSGSSEHPTQQATGFATPSSPDRLARTRINFDREVQHCGDMVKEHVNNLCFYNDEIIIPISICAPTFYICLSLCFIYLCRCDRRLKEFGHLDASTARHCSDPPKRWNWRTLPCFTGEDYGGKPSSSSSWSCSSLKATIPLRLGLSKSSHGAFSTGILSSESSSSTHELLQMRAMPGADSCSGVAASQGASRDTLNTLLSDEQPYSAVP
ncbi:hypothetical protein Btru_029546 [Bulinus truncatus]|nr:hypothetical protein Btru_029546 [Bulinus truncatus]